MFSKLSTVAFFFALWFSFMALLVSASPVPIVLPASEGISLFKDVIAREPIAVDVVKRGDLSTPELTDVEEVAKRDPLASPNLEEDVDVEARICRGNCL